MVGIPGYNWHLPPQPRSQGLSFQTKTLGTMLLLPQPHSQGFSLCFGLRLIPNRRKSPGNKVATTCVKRDLSPIWITCSTIDLNVDSIYLFLSPEKGKTYQITEKILQQNRFFVTIPVSFVHHRYS